MIKFQILDNFLIEQVVLKHLIYTGPTPRTLPTKEQMCVNISCIHIIIGF